MGRWHAHTVNKIGALVTAVIDRDHRRGSELASRYGARHLTDVDEFLASADSDVAHICTPLATHFNMATIALDAGLHVVVEKPIAASGDEAAQLARVADRASRICCPVHQLPFQRGITKLREELRLRDSGPLCVEFDIASAGGADRPEEEHDELLLEILPHPLSVLGALWPQQVNDAAGWHVERPRPGQLIAVGSHGDMPVIIKVSLQARPTRFAMALQHRQGRIEHDFFHDFVVFDSPRVSRFNKVTAPLSHSGRVFGASISNLVARGLHRQWAYPGLEELLRQFYRSVQSGETPIPAREYIAVARGCDAFRQRLTSG